VVRRFIHQQYIRQSQQDTCQRNPHFPSARERAHVAVNLIVFESQTVEHFTGLFCRVAPGDAVGLVDTAPATSVLPVP